MQNLIDLVLPRECGGCGRPDVAWCDACRDELAGDPVRVVPRADVGVPCWSLGAYGGPRRRAVVAAKERGRRDLAVPLGTAVAVAIDRLRDAGEIDPPELSQLVLVPAPTRRRAARTRGGDPVTRMCRATARSLAPERVDVANIVEMDARVRDSVGLSAAERADNLSGRVRVRAGAALPSVRTCLVVDDVTTTGATAAETVRALAARQWRVEGVLVVAHVR